MNRATDTQTKPKPKRGRAARYASTGELLLPGVEEIRPGRFRATRALPMGGRERSPVFGTVAEANAWKSDRNALHNARGGHGRRVLPTANGDALTCAQVFGQWQEMGVSTRAKELSTSKTEHSYWRNHCGFLHSMPIRAVDDFTMDKFRAELAGSGLKHNTQARIMRMIDALFEYALSRRLLPKGERNPCDSMMGKNSTDKRVKRPHITPDQLTALLGVLDSPRDRCMVLLLQFTAMRGSELFGLNVENVDLDARTVSTFWQWSKSENRRKPKKGLAEGDEEPRAGFPDFLAPLLREVIADRPGDEPLFVGRFGKRERYENWTDRVLRPAVVAAGIPGNPLMHAFRHGGATMMRAMGADLEMIRAQLNHSTLAMTRRYIDAGEAGAQVAAFFANVVPVDFGARARIAS